MPICATIDRMMSKMQYIVCLRLSYIIRPIDEGAGMIIVSF